MMTKRHFEKLAEILGSAMPELDGTSYRIGTMLCERIAALCEEDNPHFDRARFCAAVNAHAKRIDPYFLHWNG
jgi:hypothetical protein